MNIYQTGADIYDKIEHVWHSQAMHVFISRFLTFVFLFSLLLGFAVYENWLPENQYFAYFKNPFVSIEITFTFLLIIEIFGLIFAIPVSVSRSVIKQFELLSLIFLRMGLKEFSHLHKLFDWNEMQEIVVNMFVYGFAALIIFMLINFYYKIQRKLKIREYFREYPSYKRIKKNIALVLIIVFIGILINKIIDYLVFYQYSLSFKHFYTALIFSDILILVISFQFILDYHSMFRYSGYILATIFIRIALTSVPYYDIIVGIGAMLYLILLTWTYVLFMNRNVHKKPRYLQYNLNRKKFKFS